MERQKESIGSEDQHEAENSVAPSQASHPGSLDDEDVNDLDLAEVMGEEAFQQLPPEARGWMARFVSNVTSIGIAPTNPVHRRLTSEHVSTMLTHLDRDRERGHTSEASARKYQFLYFIIGVAVAIGLIIFFSLRGEREIMFTLIVALFSFAGGFGLGLHRGRQ